jgi:hypothetical protein
MAQEVVARALIVFGLAACAACASAPDARGAKAHASRPSVIADTPVSARSTARAGAKPRSSPEHELRMILEAAIDDANGPPVALRGRTFEGECFRIEGVPDHTTLFLVGKEPSTYELRDRGGRRLALLQEESWVDATDPLPAHMVETQPVFTRATGSTFFISDWGGHGPALIEPIQINALLCLIRIERVFGHETAWITSRLWIDSDD